MLVLVLIIAVVVRLFAALFYNLSHPMDMNTFQAWSLMLTETGFSGFYSRPEFTDYPPGYMYVLAALGHIWRGLQGLFGLSGGPWHTMLLKSPAILADVLTVFFIYKIATKFDNKEGGAKSLFPITAALLYAANPAVILNSALWGQVDSIHTLLIALSVYFIAGNKMAASTLVFTASVMVKPQSLIFSPIYLFMFYKYIFGMGRPKFNSKNFRNLLLCGAACFALMAVMILPFIDFSNLPSNPLEIPVLSQYVSTFFTYDLVSHNAYNFYSFFGLNYAPVSQIAFLGISFNTLGVIFIALITLFSLYLLYRKNDIGSVFLVAAFLVFATFMLSTRMHERYGFPAMALLLLAAAVLRDKRLIWLYIGLSAAFFLNYADVLAMSLNNFNFQQIAYSAQIFALPSIALFIYAIHVILTVFTNRPLLKFRLPPLKYKDALVCGAITLFYAVFAFTNLGSNVSPQNPYIGVQNRPVIVDFGGRHQVHRLQFLSGPPDAQRFNIEFSDDGHTWYGPLELTAQNVFTWQYHNFGRGQARFARITPTSARFYMMEIAFKDQNLELIPIVLLSPNGAELFDEQNTIPTAPRSYFHSAYFDEIFHARTAYEFLNQLPVFEWTHPPLGKVLISQGIQIFGMNPFGWRFMGTFLGVLMLPLIYLLAKKMFRATFWAGFATFIFAFDFMHYAQTRLATIDTFVVIFIMGMYYCMYLFHQSNYLRQPLYKSLLPLLFCGIFAGLAVASKWQGAYALIGLVIIFFRTLFLRYNEHKADEAKSYWKNTLAICTACLLFFIVIPLIIYIASYIPYRSTNSLYPNLPFLQAVFQNQIDMFNYHAHTVLSETHPFSSPWWEWIINWRPIFIYFNNLGDGMVQAISSFGNPLIWWAGLVAFAYTVYTSFRYKDKIAFFLIIAYLSQLIPWFFVARITFIYHYFPMLLFIVLMITYSFKNLTKSQKPAIIFAIAAFAIFLLFYPVLTGIPISRDFIINYLRWLPAWTLTG